MGVAGKYVFLSGPITGQPHDAVDKFAVAHRQLKDAGAEYVFNPALTALFKRQRKYRAMTHGDWMADCIHELTLRQPRDQEWHDVVPLKYDVVVQLDDWELSEGATMEYQVAKACGIPCVSMREALRG